MNSQNLAQPICLKDRETIPAKDIQHSAFKAALIKDGWRITHDPLTLRPGRRSVFVDIGAERLIAAEKDHEKIAVEIKSFLSPSFIDDLEKTWGQFFMYAGALQRKAPDRVLYLAVSSATFDTIYIRRGWAASLGRARS